MIRQPIKKLVIGLTGLYGTEASGFTQAQAGKDTAAQRLVDKHNFTKIALADGVRDSLYSLDPFVAPGVRLSSIVDAHGWDQAKNDPEIRRLLQYTGTEAGRDLHGDHVWISLAFRKISNLPLTTNVVITDVRFLNEARWVKRQGGIVVRIQRSSKSSVNNQNANHVSETGWRLLPIDHVLTNDGTIPELHEKVDALIASFK